MMNVKNNSSIVIEVINKLVLVGLLLTSTVIFTFYTFGYKGGFVSIVSFFLGYILVIYSIASFLWVGLIYAVQRKQGFFRTLYSLNGLIAFIACLVIFFV